MDFRMGIHMGDVIYQGPCIYGDTVNIAVRLQSMADPGGIHISRAVYEQVRHILNLCYENLGEHCVRNIPDPVEVYRVRKDI
jgi:adenylate cyclase